MKKIITFITLTILLTSCEFEKLTTVQDDFAITITADPVSSLVNLKVFDSKDGSDIPEEITLTFSGSDAEKVHTISGTKNFKVENGLITVGINRNISVSSETPLQITANVSANGYMPKSQTINFDGEAIQEVQISMMNRDDLPASTFLKSVTETLVDNKTTKEVLIEIPPVSDEDDVMEVSIPADTEFYDENGNVMTGGDVTIDLQTFDTTVPSIDELSDNVTNPETLAGGFNEFPGSLEISAASKSNNFNKTSAVTSYLSPIGSLYCIYYYVNGRRVSGVSRPTTYSFSVNSNTINPNTGQRVKAGDIISFYRTVNNTNTKVADVPISSRTGWWGRTYLAFTVTIPAGPGIYPYGFEVAPSCNNLTSGVTFKNDGRKTFYRYYVANKYNPRRALRWGYMYFDETYEVNISNLGYWRNRALGMLKDDMVLTVYYYSYQDRRYKIAYSEEVSKCDLDGQTIDISNQDCFQERDLDLSIDCPEASYRLNYLSVYYKPESRRYFSYFDRVRDSKLTGKTPCLDDGVKYNFGFYYNGWKETTPLTEAQMVKLYNEFDLVTICSEIRKNR
jgi:hypothetical protein